MRRDLRLLPVAGAVWSVALVSVFVPVAVVWSGALCAVVGCVALAMGARRGGATHVSGWGLVLVSSAAAGAVCLAVAGAAQGRAEVTGWDGRVVEVTGEITSSASVGSDGRLWLDVGITGIGAPGAVTAVSAPARIGVDPGKGFDLGAAVRVVGQVMATDQGERAAVVVFATEAEIDRPAEGVFAVAAGMREAFVTRSLALPEPGAGLLPGLAVGDTRAVTPELNSAMVATGLSHLTAVSGANCAIVVGAVFWLAALCGAGRILRCVLAASALAGFVVLVTPEPSVIRAAVMAGAGMLSVLLGRPSAGAGMLALSAIGILIADPWLAATPGFALSVAASGALVLLAPPLARGLTRWMPAPLGLAIAVPLAAQLACGPIIALFAEQQSMIGVAANLLAAPAAPVATVIGLLACLAMPVPPLADLLAASAWLPAAWIATTAEMSSRLPAAQVLLPAGIPSAVIVAIVSASVGVLLVGGFRTIRTVRVVAGGTVAVTLAIGGAQVVLDGPLASATSPAGWSIAACDVGQGDALVVRSEGRIALIDTGPDPEPLAACLRALGIERVDLLVLTHFDLDHVGGVDAVRGRVGEVLHGPVGEDRDERTLRSLSEGGAVLTPASAGMRGLLGAAQWRVDWPERGSRAFPPRNDQSIVIEFSGGEVPRSLFLGDLSAQAQRMLLRTRRVTGAYPVVKVSHHGSADQEPELYATVLPAAALFSVGAGNDYGHPRVETLTMIEARGASLLRTDQQGRLLLGVRDGRLEVWTDRRPP